MKKGAFSSSLRLQAIVSILLLFIISIVTVTGLTYSQAKTQILDSLRRGAEQTVSIHAQGLATWVQTRLAEVEVIANTDLVKTLDYGKIIPYLEREVKRSKGVYNSFGISDTKGNLTLQNGVVIDISVEDTFPLVMKGQSIISNPFPAKENPQDLIISMEVPITNPDGQVVGLISGASLINTVFSSNADFRLGETDQVFILHKDGTVLHHPNREWVLNHNLLKDSEPAYQAAIQRGLGGTGLSTQVSVGGEEKMLFSAPISGTDWVMFLEVPLSEYTQSLNKLLLQTFLVSLGVLVLLGLVVWGLTKLLFRRIAHIVKAVEQIGRGDLRHELPESSDELGRLARGFNAMTLALRGIIGEVMATSTTLASSSQELTASLEGTKTAVNQVAQTSTEISHGAEQTSKNIEKAANTMKDLAQAMEQIQAGADQLANNSKEMGNVAEEGSRAVGKAVDKMNIINDSVVKSGEVIQELGVRSQKIGEIVEVITAIADQTNLLALNAAIEAARAGEQGRGFAVVADEVRKLAEQSQTAAKEIADIIQDMQNGTQKAVHTMESGIQEVAEGVNVVRDAGEVLEKIKAAAKEVADLVNNIAQIIKVQTGNSNEVAKAITEVAVIAEETSAGTQNAAAATEETLAAVEQLADSAENLAKIAQNLQSHVASFKV